MKHLSVFWIQPFHQIFLKMDALVNKSLLEKYYKNANFKTLAEFPKFLLAVTEGNSLWSISYLKELI